LDDHPVAESETRATIAQALCNAKLNSQPNNYRSGRLTNHPSCGGGEMVERVKQRQQSLLLYCRDKTGTPFSPSGVLTRVHSFTTRQRGQKHQARPSLLQRRLFKESGFIYLSIYPQAHHTLDEAPVRYEGVRFVAAAPWSGRVC
jgi:hypothetical protein